MNDEQKQKVLVADDDPAILQLVKAIVKKEGYEPVEAKNGKEAYKILHSGTPFIAAIFDIVMPHIQGTELLRFMQSDEKLKKVPVIIMTAEENPRLSTDSFTAGAVVFLHKPFTASQLIVMLKMCVERGS